MFSREREACVKVVHVGDCHYFLPDRQKEGPRVEEGSGYLVAIMPILLPWHSKHSFKIILLNSPSL